MVPHDCHCFGTLQTLRYKCLHVIKSVSSADLFCIEQAPFLERLTAIQPDLCITAAYGNVLPSKFLSIPRFGTLNIHPSLLPKYRGAAPVQRAIQVCFHTFKLPV